MADGGGAGGVVFHVKGDSMSEFFDVIPRELFAPQTEMKVQDRRQQEFRLVARQRKVPGHTLFCIDLKTGEIKAAPVMRSSAVDFRTKMPTFSNRIVVEPGHVYRQALNKKNFIKILKRERILVTRVPKEGDVVVNVR